VTNNKIANHTANCRLKFAKFVRAIDKPVKVAFECNMAQVNICDFTAICDNTESQQTLHSRPEYLNALSFNLYYPFIYIIQNPNSLLNFFKLYFIMNFSRRLACLECNAMHAWNILSVNFSQIISINTNVNFSVYVQLQSLMFERPCYH